jgi:hypothetical protein
VETGRKTVIASRLKPSGRFWIVLGSNAIIALRRAYLEGRSKDYWEFRLRVA